MGRTPLINRYLPFIDRVMKDLQITDREIIWKWDRNPTSAFKGTCGWPEGSFTIWHTITLNRRLYGQTGIYETIAHELRHVWQMKHDLLVCKKGIVIWNGETTHSYHKKNAVYLEWKQRPEEIDAIAYSKRALRKLL